MGWGSISRWIDSYVARIEDNAIMTTMKTLARSSARPYP